MSFIDAASGAGALWPYFDDIAQFDSALSLQNLPQRLGASMIFYALKCSCLILEV